jgi:hypothetical protein
MSNRMGPTEWSGVIKLEKEQRMFVKRIHLAMSLWLSCIVAAVLVSTTAVADELPRVERRGQATQLIVDGKPYIALGGELHNSSSSSPAFMAPIWDRLTQNGVRTVIGAASWELVERQEGRFDFAAVDDLVRQAKAHGMRLVMLWFGAFKNAVSTYAPTWVRRDLERFPRAERDPNAKITGLAANMEPGATLSVFNDRLLTADARAFAALMRHLHEVDRDHTVIMVQVENEVGLLGDSRDRSALATDAWSRPVPAELMKYLQDNRAVLRPLVLDTWARQGFRTSGTWAEVFGTGKAADEIFMSWGFGRYVGSVAKAGSAQYPLPMYANAWLGPQADEPEPGDYPSGGPVARMMDIWRSAAPSLAFTSPDIYIDDFVGTLEDFHRPNNPIFVPEARPDAGNAFIALAEYKAIGFSPFGIEDFAPEHELFKAYKVLDTMLPEIAQGQQNGSIRGFRLAMREQRKFTFGRYDVSILGPGSNPWMFGVGTPPPANSTGYGLVIQTGEDEFLIVGRAVDVKFTADGRPAEMDSVEEGVFENGRWIPGRTLDGDERYFLFPVDALRTVRVRLLRH